MEAIATGRPLGIESAVTPGLSFYRLPDFVRLDRLSFSVYAFHFVVFLTPASALQNYRMQYGIMHMQKLF